MSKQRYGEGGYYATCDVCRSETTYKNLHHSDPIFICSYCSGNYETCYICNRLTTNRNMVAVKSDNHYIYFSEHICHDCVVKNEKIISLMIANNGNTTVLDKIQSILKPRNNESGSDELPDCFK